MTPKLKLVGTTDEGRARYPIRHRSSLPGYEWPIRLEHERGDAVPARAATPSGLSRSASSCQHRIAIAGGKQ